MERPSCSLEQGQELVEFALLLPLLMLLLLGVIEFGLAVMRYNAVANVGREVARYAIVHPQGQAIEEFINKDNGYGEGLRPWTRSLITDDLDITFTLHARDFPSSTVEVTVTYSHGFLTAPLIQALGGQPTVTLQSVSTMFTELPIQE